MRVYPELYMNSFTNIVCISLKHCSINNYDKKIRYDTKLALYMFQSLDWADIKYNVFLCCIVYNAIINYEKDGLSDLTYSQRYDIRKIKEDIKKWIDAQKKYKKD